MLEVSTTAAQDDAVDRAAARRGRARRPEEAVALSREEVGRAHLAGLPPRRLVPRRGHRAAGAARARAAPRRARRRRHAARADERHRRSSTGSSRTAGGHRPRAGDRRRDERVDERLAAGARPADAVRQLRRPHRARSRAPRGDRLDGRRGDRRRPDVPPLLPDDRRRACPDGLRLRADRSRRAGSTRASSTTRRRSRAPSTACAGCCPGLAGARSSARGVARSTSPATSCRSSARCPGARIHYGAGYSGNGVGPSWLGGQILASLVLGADDEWSRLPLARIGCRQRLPPEPFRYVGRRRWCAGRSWRSRRRTRAAAGRRPVTRGVAALPRVLGLRIGTR